MSEKINVNIDTIIMGRNMPKRKVVPKPMIPYMEHKHSTHKITKGWFWFPPNEDCKHCKRNCKRIKKFLMRQKPANYDCPEFMENIE